MVIMLTKLCFFGCKKESKYETYTEQYLQSCGYVRDVGYVREKTYPGLKGLGGQSLRFDFLVKLHNGIYN